MSETVHVESSRRIVSSALPCGAILCEKAKAAWSAAAAEHEGRRTETCRWRRERRERLSRTRMNTVRKRRAQAPCAPACHRCCSLSWQTAEEAAAWARAWVWEQAEEPRRAPACRRAAARRRAGATARSVETISAAGLVAPSER